MRYFIYYVRPIKVEKKMGKNNRSVATVQHRAMLFCSALSISVALFIATSSCRRWVPCPIPSTLYSILTPSGAIFAKQEVCMGGNHIESGDGAFPLFLFQENFFLFLRSPHAGSSTFPEKLCNLITRNRYLCGGGGGGLFVLVGDDYCGISYIYFIIVII